MADDVGRAGEPDDSFDAIYRRYYRLILSTAERRVNGVAAAEDVAAEVFRIAWQHHGRGETLTMPWLYATVRNVVGNDYRRQARLNNLVERIGATVVSHTTHDDVDTALDVARAMQRLKPTDREVLQLAYWDDLDGHELAQVLGISRIAARSRLMRARRLLRAELTGAYDSARHPVEVIDFG